METTPDVPVHSEKISPRRFAAGIERLPIVFVNVYMVGELDGPWVLVDTGMPGFAGRIRRAAEARYGGRPPEAIVLMGTSTTPARRWSWRTTGTSRSTPTGWSCRIWTAGRTIRRTTPPWAAPSA